VEPRPLRVGQRGFQAVFHRKTGANFRFTGFLQAAWKKGVREKPNHQVPARDITPGGPMFVDLTESDFSKVAQGMREGDRGSGCLPRSDTLGSDHNKPYKALAYEDKTCYAPKGAIADTTHCRPGKTVQNLHGGPQVVCQAGVNHRVLFSAGGQRHPRQIVLTLCAEDESWRLIPNSEAD